MTVLAILMIIFCGLIALSVMRSSGGNNEYKLWKSKQSKNYLMWFGHEERSQAFFDLCKHNGVTPPEVD